MAVDGGSPRRSVSPYHNHDGTDSELVDYGDLANVPTSFTPSAHGHDGLLPAGGTENQVLAKDSGDDYDVKWTTVAGTGDVVGPASSEDGNVATFSGTGGKTLQDGGSTIAEIIASAKLASWPIGAVYVSVVNTSPDTLFGGTWQSIGAGRVLVGVDAGDPDFNSVEETGGSKTVASSAQSFSGNALETHQHAAVSAGTPAGTNEAESSHTHSVTSNVTSAANTGSESSHTHSVTSNVTSAANTGSESSHTHTYTQVVNHTHTVNVGSANDTSTVTGAGNYFAGTTSTVAATTGNPSGGVASGTTSAGDSHNHSSPALTNNAVTSGAGSSHNHSSPALTNNAVTSGSGSSHNHAFNGSAMATHQHDAISAGTPSGTNTPGAATSVVQPYFVVYMWKRTA